MHHKFDSKFKIYILCSIYILGQVGDHKNYFMKEGCEREGIIDLWIDINSKKYPDINFTFSIDWLKNELKITNLIIVVCTSKLYCSSVCT